ncbi:hypothetical protein A4D02_28445 [Niastella koreensis]|uniref:TnsA endonuclease N-terminal domain-containing protein n=2 Tax=Niastella koreensis TaxID=354356 RepID=G8T8J8_NIAKG|nr:hypothetical protein [Niastella koreensis]AEW00170.1 hypothetical protein Niako_3884 [Niastella koreensis GR20-10]OQP49526.1 hypothetical protein A4D02_28445 [Niastella koreensis]
MQPFKYLVSHKIIYWGCLFDSLLELKYAISIHKDYEFLRAYIPVYYDPKTRKPVVHIRGNTRRYTPDFLIRHKLTREAHWVEIKPGAFASSPQLVIRKEVAENYIRWKKYDWSFKVVFDDEIVLPPEDEQLFNEYKKLLCKSAGKLDMEAFNKLFNRAVPPFYASVPDQKRIRYVMYGTSSCNSSGGFPT